MRTISRIIAAGLPALLRLLPPKSDGPRILLIHQLLVGDGILVWPLLHRLEHEMRVAIACPLPLIALYQKFFPGFSYFAFSERDPSSVIKLLWTARKCDQVICPIESRLHRYALALRPNMIIGYGRDTGHTAPAGLLPFPTERMTFSDMMNRLVRPSSNRFNPPLNISLSHERRCIIHVDARNPNRRWKHDKWRELATRLRQCGFKILWCGGTASSGDIETLLEPGEEPLSPTNLLTYLAAIQSAALLVCPDTGIAHLAKLTSTPTIVIYGQGNPALHGNGEYWSNARTLNIFQEQIPCRDKDTVMGFKVDWLRRCDRTPSECQNPFCQNDISVQDIIESARLRFPELFLKPPPTPQQST